MELLNLLEILDELCFFLHEASLFFAAMLAHFDVHLLQVLSANDIGLVEGVLDHLGS